MNVFLKKCTAAALCFCMLAATGCGSGSGDTANTPMGRYVESRLEFPEGKEPIKILQRSDGTIDAYYLGTEGSSIVKRCSTPDGEKWDTQELDWTVPQGQFVNSIAYDSSDRAYLASISYGDDGSVMSYIYREDNGGKLLPVTMDWRDASGAPTDQAFMDGGIQIMDNGDLLIGNYGSGVGQYSADGAFRRFLTTDGSGGPISFTSSGESIYMTDSGAGAVIRYNGKSGTMEESIPFDSFSDSTMIGHGKEGAVYVYNRSGIYRLAEGGSLWEKLVDGSLTSMCIPSCYMAYLIEGTDGSLYMQGSDNGTHQLYKYTYDKSIASLPEKELIVYSLYDNSALQQAAGEFQRSHPDTRVNIQTAMEQGEAAGAATASDLIRALNTELLSGKGPDVLLLDQMPVESYIEKGVLMDLSDVLSGMKADATMNETVVETYKNKDGIFAVPTKFNMPVLVADAGVVGELKDLDSIAAWAQVHGDKPLMGNKSAQNLMDAFFPSCAPVFLKDGKIDEDGLKSFLENIKVISDTPAKSYEEAEVDKNQQFSFSGSGMISSSSKQRKNSDDIFHWAFGRAHTYAPELAGEGSLTSLMLAMRKEGNGAIISLPGQTSQVFIPQGVIGINGKTQMEESAKAFVELMLSENQQAATANRGGFPVNLAALETAMKSEDTDVFMSMGGSNYDENEELSGAMPSPAEKKGVWELCKGVKVAYKKDDVLAEMIQTEALGYFTGEKEIAETISDIKEATKLYLSE